jgi:hypothetical protein
MRKKLLPVALVAIIVALSACMKQENPAKRTGDPSAVKIGLVSGGGEVRAVGEAITGTTTESTLTAGHIFFYNSTTGLIDKHVGLDQPGITPNETLTDLRAGGVVITGVDGNVDRCMIVFNDNGLITTSMTGRQMSEVLDAVVLVAEINNTDGSIDNVPLTGTAPLDDVDGSAAPVPYTRQVDMRVTPVGTRLQVGRISAGSYTPEGGGDVVAITAFTVDGIFVTHVNSRMTMSGVAATAPEVDYLQDQSKYVAPTVTGSGYATGGPGEKLTDIPDQATGAGDPPAVLAGATATGVWAYNLLPTTIPHIVIRLSDVQYTIGTGEPRTLAGFKWLTVSRYHFDAGTGDTPVEEFEPGEVYTIGNLVFNWSHMTDLPETKDGDVNVKVTVAPWVNNDVHWDNN